MIESIKVQMLESLWKNTDANFDYVEKINGGNENHE